MQKEQNNGCERQNGFHTSPEAFHRARTSQERSVPRKSPPRAGSGMRMLTYFIKTRRARTQRRQARRVGKAKTLLSDRVRDEKDAEAKESGVTLLYGARIFNSPDLSRRHMESSPNFTRS